MFQRPGNLFNPTLNINGGVQQREGFTDDVTSEMAAEWMTGADARPFLAVVGFKSCHSPFEPPPRTSKLYEGVEMPRPPSFDRALPDQPAWIQKFDDTGHTPYSRIPADELALRFARLVTAADDNVARMVAALERAGQLDRTLIIFSSDNGFLIHEHGLYDKRAMYEESIRIPLLMRYPALIRRGAVDDLTLNVDLAPTLLDLIGAGGADEMQGISILPALRAQRRQKRSIFFYQYDRETPYSTPSLPASERRNGSWCATVRMDRRTSCTTSKRIRSRFATCSSRRRPGNSATVWTVNWIGWRRSQRFRGQSGRITPQNKEDRVEAVDNLTRGPREPKLLHHSHGCDVSLVSARADAVHREGSGPVSMTARAASTAYP